MSLLVALLSSLLLEYVNPFVGTDAHGHTFPGAASPFGMVQLSPDTRPRAGDWDGCSGYHYSDRYIYGFSHTHLSGTGCDDLCDVLLMPVTGYGSDVPDPMLYRSEFSHGSEKASPGYYEVRLDGPGVLARMTVGERCGMHEYSYPRGVTPQMILDLGHRDFLEQGSVHHWHGNRSTLCGHRRSSSWARGQDVWFYLEFSEPVSSVQLSERGAVITFASTYNNVLTVRAAISSVSEDNARANLHADYPKTFDSLRRSTERRWERTLMRVPCPDEDLEATRVFYTALYHCYIHPSLYSDANGEYRGMDGRVHKAVTREGRSFRRYTIFSLWDTFRGLHPLMSRIEPRVTADFLRTFQSIYDEGGRLPVWELWGYETDCMIGYNSAPVIADALQAGVGSLLSSQEIERLLEALLASSQDGGHGLGSFRTNGLVLADDEHESVSKTLEYAYDDWCVAQVAAWLRQHGEPGRVFSRARLAKIEESYLQSSQYWRNVLDLSTGFMRARLNGRWVSPFDPREVNNHYTEANSWQYSFFVPHDVAGLVEALGGRDAFEARLDALFEAPEQTTGRTQADITGQIGQYAHGNEPSHHIAYLYKCIGRQDKSLTRVQQIMRSLYSSRPDGLCGNEDCGQMSAWYVLSAQGQYPLCPGAPDEYSEGSSLKMTSVPRSIVVNPVFEMDSDIFADSTIVSLGLAQGEEQLWWRMVPESLRTPLDSMDYRCGLDSTQTDLFCSGQYIPYSGPLQMRRTGTLQAYAQAPDGTRSFVTTSALHRIHTDMKVRVLSEYSSQYSAGGDIGLIDDVRGRINWRTGGWQGYQGCDFEAEVDLLDLREIHQVGAGFCQDARSWIWMPVDVEFSWSVDGEHFYFLDRVGHSVDPRDYEVQIHDLECSMEPLMVCEIGYPGEDGEEEVTESVEIWPVARYIRIKARNFGTIPLWHPGAGCEAFIFTDEVWVR